MLDIEIWHWTKLNVSGRKPPARYYHSSCCIAGPLTGQQHPLLLVIGGYRGKAFGDVWLLDVDKEKWSEITLPVPITPRGAHSAVAFGRGQSFRLMVLFGGRKSWAPDGILSDTTLLLMELGGTSWQVTRVVKPYELVRPNWRLKEQMKKLELSPQEGELSTQNTSADGAGLCNAHRDTTSPSPPHTIERMADTTPDNASIAAVITHKDTTPTSGSELKTSPIIDIAEVQIGDCIGQGGFGAVFEAKWKKKKVAVKVCPGNLIKNVSREIEVLTSLPSHTNVITFFGVALSSDQISTLIITELASNGSLHNYLHVKKQKPSLDQSIGWAQQIAAGMQHLHRYDIVHRDLKSGNVLLASGLLTKICDFGTARTLVKTSNTTQKGTARWMAPEITEDVEANINKMCDVFSYGMVLYEIFAHKVPYDNIPTNALVGLAILQGKRPPVPPKLPPYLCPLLEDCWKNDPSQRPQFEAIILAIQTESYK